MPSFTKRAFTVVLTLAVLALLLSIQTEPRAGSTDTLDIQAELSKPGVKVLVVEFYATSCKPCMEAVPKWKELHAKYKRAGLRFIVVSAEEDRTCSRPPSWSPDETLCDADFSLMEAMGVQKLPTSFLYSWDGKLAMKSHDVDAVDEAIHSYFRDTHYKVEVEPVEVIGDKYAISGNPERVRAEVVAQIRHKSKIDVVSERRSATPRGSSGLCSVEFPANSTLRIKLLGYDTGERMLSLEIEQDGCTKAQATYPYTGKGFTEDWSSLKRAIRRAVADLLGQIVRVKNAELVGGGQSDGDSWFSGSELVVLRFESNPAGATVLVDNQPACDNTPCSKSFPKGVHTVTMLKTDYITRSESVNASEDRTVQWTLEPNFGWLTVSGAPNGLDVKIDGQLAGKAPLTQYQLSPGRHRVEIDSPCYYPVTATQQITRNTETVWDATIKPREAGLDVSTVDENGNDLRADVYVDGENVGTAPGRFKINICARKLEVRADGYRNFSQDLQLTEKQVVAVKAVMKSGGVVPVDDQTWTDAASGLMWQAMPPSNNMSWGSAKAYCSNLSLSGYSDWRLPSILELRSLIRGCSKTEKGGSCNIGSGCKKWSCRAKSCDGCSNKGGPGASGHYWPKELPDVDKWWFWSSSPVDDVGARAWFVSFGYGYVGIYSVGPIYARCVRDDQTSAPEEQYPPEANNGLAPNGNTWRDNKTGLMWQVEPPAQKMKWTVAKSYCESLSLAAYTDWRLPEIDELKSLIITENKNYGCSWPAIMGGSCSRSFWSSSSVAQSSNSAWSVVFSSGYVGKGDKSDFYYYARCVRDIKSTDL